MRNSHITPIRWPSMGGDWVSKVWNLWRHDYIFFFLFSWLPTDSDQSIWKFLPKKHRKNNINDSIVAKEWQERKKSKKFDKKIAILDLREKMAIVIVIRAWWSKYDNLAKFKGNISFKSRL